MTARASAAFALGVMEPATAEAVPALCGALGDADANVRRAVAEALGRLGPAAVPALRAALGDADEYVRQAIEAIERARSASG